MGRGVSVGTGVEDGADVGVGLSPIPPISLFPLTSATASTTASISTVSPLSAQTHTGTRRRAKAAAGAPGIALGITFVLFRPGITCVFSYLGGAARSEGCKEAGVRVPSSAAAISFALYQRRERANSNAFSTTVSAL